MNIGHEIDSPKKVIAALARRMSTLKMRGNIAKDAVAIVNRLAGKILLFCVAIAVLASCAQAPVLQSSESYQIPVFEADTFVVDDGARLPYVAWRPASSPQRVIIAVHGFSDYRRAFELPAPFWADMGAIVYAYDQRGFGQAPSVGVWAGSARLVADLSQIVALVRAQHPNLPLFLVGDSMGAAVVCLVAQNSTPGILAGVVLNAPAVWGAQSFNPVYRGVLWVAAHVVPSWEMTGRGVKVTVTDNTPLLRALGRDPYMLKTARVDALYGMVSLMDEAQHAAPNLRVRTLLLYGERDEVIPKPAVCAFAAALPDSPTIFFYPDGYHLLLRDYGAPLVWSDAAAWFAGESRSASSWRQNCGDAVVSENP